MRPWAKSLRKSPNRWFWFTLLVLLLAITILVPLEREDQNKSWIGLVAAALIVCTAAVSTMHLPRARFPEDVRPAVYWALAVAPALLGLMVPVLGGGDWVAGPGLIVSITLLRRTSKLISKSAI